MNFTPSLSLNPSTKILTLAQATRLNLTSVSYSPTATSYTTGRCTFQLILRGRCQSNYAHVIFLALHEFVFLVPIAPKSRNYVSPALPESMDNVRCGVSANNAARFPWSTVNEHQTILTTIPSLPFNPSILSSPFRLLPCRPLLASPFFATFVPPFCYFIRFFIPFNSWRLSSGISDVSTHPPSKTYRHSSSTSFPEHRFLRPSPNLVCSKCHIQLISIRYVFTVYIGSGLIRIFNYLVVLSCHCLLALCLSSFKVIVN